MKSVLAGCGLALVVAAAPFALVSATNAAPASSTTPLVLAQADAPAADAAAPAAPAADAAAAPAADAAVPAAAASAGAVERDAFGLPLGPGHDLTVAKCSGCHDVSEFSGQRHSSDQWADVIGSMIGRGADISNDDFAAIQTYLATNLAPGAQ
jgi:hypothetical protein